MKYIILLGMLAIMSVQCTQDQSSTDELIQVLPESLSVTNTSYDIFFEDYQKFINGFSETQSILIADFIINNENADNNSNGRVNGSSCTCAAGSTTCNASGSISDCCICCPPGRAAACGSYWGVAQCKCETIKRDPGAKAVETDRTVRCFPRKIEEILTFASKNGIDIDKINASFQTLMKANM